MVFNMNKIEIYLILLDKETNKEFKKYFKCEFDKEKFKRKLRYSKKLIIIDENYTDNYK